MRPSVSCRLGELKFVGELLLVLPSLAIANTFQLPSLSRVQLLGANGFDCRRHIFYA